MGLYDNVLVDHLFFFLVAIVLPGLSLRRGELQIQDYWSTRDKIVFYYTNSIVLWFASFIVLGLWIFTYRSLIDFGFTIPAFNIWALISSGLLLFLYFLELVYDFYTQKGLEKVLTKWHKKARFMPIKRQEYLHYCFLSLTAGVTEEIIFRGFLMNYIFSLSHREGPVEITAAIMIPALIFGVVHIYQGKQAMLKIIFASILFGLIYYFSKSLLWVIIIHVLIDMVTGYFVMQALAKNSKKEQEDLV